VLVAVRASEQGPAEVDVARWTRADRSGEECWLAADSDPGCLVVYAEGELTSWMPLPSTLPKLRSERLAAGEPAPASGSGESGGSGI
jgi:hypothetical protein